MLIWISGGNTLLLFRILGGIKELKKYGGGTTTIFFRDVSRILNLFYKKPFLGFLFYGGEETKQTALLCVRIRKEQICFCVVKTEQKQWAAWSGVWDELGCVSIRSESIQGDRILFSLQCFLEKNKNGKKCY